MQQPRSRNRTCGSGCVLLVMALLLAHGPFPVARAAEAEQTAQLQEQVNQLIEQLGSSRLAERREAEAGLVKLGPPVLPLLPDPVLLPDEGVRETVRRVRLRLEDVQARQSIQSSVVQLSGRFTVEEAARAMEKQTGNRLRTDILPDDVREQTVQVEFAEKPFWEAVTSLQQQTETWLDDSGPDRVVAFAPVGEPARTLFLNVLEGPASMARPVGGSGTEEPPRPLAVHMAARSVRLSPIFGNDREQLLTVSLEARVEPRLRPLFLRYGERGLVATAAGERLRAFNPDSLFELPFGSGNWSAGVRAQFVLPAGDVPEQIDLTGTLAVYLAAGEEEFRFSGLPGLRRVSRRKGGVNVTVQQASYRRQQKADQADAGADAPVENQRGTVEIALAVAWDTGGPAFESHRTWMYHNAAWLENGSGRRIPHRAELEFRQQADGGLAVSYRFEDVPGDPADWSFRYRAPTLLIDVPLQFSLQNIPLAVDQGDRVKKPATAPRPDDNRNPGR